MTQCKQVRQKVIYQIVINAICRILNENIFTRSIRQIDVKKIRIPDKKYFLDPWLSGPLLVMSLLGA